MNKSCVIGCSFLAVGMAWGETTKFGSVIGYWQFNEAPYKADSSPFANDLTTFASGVAGASGTGSAENVDSTVYFPVNVSGSALSIGGEVGASFQFIGTVEKKAGYKDGRNRIAYSVKGDGESVSLADAQGGVWFDLPVGTKVMRNVSFLGRKAGRGQTPVVGM